MAAAERPTSTGSSSASPAFERTLTDDGALILKFWMHLGKSAQKKRLRTLEKDPLTRWRVTKRQWQHWRMYDKFVAAAERALRRTSTVDAPWTIVEGVDEAYRSLTVAKSIRDAIRKALAAGPRRAPADDPARPDRRRQNATRGRSGDSSRSRRRQRRLRGCRSSSLTILSSLDMSQAVSKKDFANELEKYQGRLNLLQRKAEQKRRLDDPGVRRAGRGRQGRRDQADHRRAGRAVVSGHPHRRANRRRTGAPLSLALLASPVARRAADDLRSQLVRARAGGAGRRICDRAGMEARVLGDQ